MNKTPKQLRQWKRFQEKGRKTAGRKWFDGKDEKEVIAKLEETAQLDASVEECLFWADISRDSYYRYLKANPDFAIRLEKLRETPVFTARKAAVEKMKESYTTAMDYLKRKRKKEFGDAIEVVKFVLIDDEGKSTDNKI